MSSSDIWLRLSRCQQILVVLHLVQAVLVGKEMAGQEVMRRCLDLAGAFRATTSNQAIEWRGAEPASGDDFVADDRHFQLAFWTQWPGPELETRSDLIRCRPLIEEILSGRSLTLEPVHGGRDDLICR